MTCQLDALQRYVLLLFYIKNRRVFDYLTMYKGVLMV